METLSNGLKRAHGLGRRWGPYLLVEALVPGGTLLALVLYVYRNRRSANVVDDAPAPAELPGG